MIVNYEKQVYPENIFQVIFAFLFVEFFELLKMLGLYDSENGFKKRKLFWYSIILFFILFFVFLASIATSALLILAFRLS